MQTFLPYADFQKSVEVLDYKRLGKQRVEAKQIIECLEGISNQGWKHHPAVKMWGGYIEALKLYHNIIIEEWIKRGYNNNMSFYIIDCNEISVELPPWFGRQDFHDAHKSKLLQKDYDYYKKYGWKVPLDLEYKWR